MNVLAVLRDLGLPVGAVAAQMSPTAWQVRLRDGRSVVLFDRSEPDRVWWTWRLLDKHGEPGGAWAGMSDLRGAARSIAVVVQQERPR